MWIADSRDASFTGYMISQGNEVNTSTVNRYLNVLDENIALREQREKVHQEILSYIKEHVQV
jgi:hypothetical protein